MEIRGGEEVNSAFGLEDENWREKKVVLESRVLRRYSRTDTGLITYFGDNRSLISSTRTDRSQALLQVLETLTCSYSCHEAVLYHRAVALSWNFP